MEVKCVEKITSRLASDAIVLPFFQKGKKVVSAFEKMGVKFQRAFKKPIDLHDFSANLGDIFLIYPQSNQEKRLILLGLGASLSVEAFRRAYSMLTTYCHEHKLQKIAVAMPLVTKFSSKEIIQGVCEGLFLANYVYESLKGSESNKTTLIKQCQFIGVETQNKSCVTKWKILSEGVCLARDLVNGNADQINASALTDLAQSLSEKFPKIKTHTLDKKKLEKENLRLILAVNQASKVDPALIIMHYRGNPRDKDSVTLIGKGVTYDTGGLQLKPRNSGIIHMKADMSGAAAVYGAIYAAAKLDMPLNLVGVIPACENAIGPNAYKPGDVYESYLGKTVEIISTDAEGRLALADALAYAHDQYGSSHTIDLATLTGGVIAALGNQYSGLMSNNPNLTQKIKDASMQSGEKVWELPLCRDYSIALKSTIADLKNATRTPGYPAAIVAGLFLQEFVKSTSWAHLDIAGTAYLSDPKYYHKTKASGVGVRLVIALLEELLESK